MALFAVTLGACASGGDEQGRAEFAAMLRVEEVPGVLLASYASYFQIDPAAPEQEIVDTAMAVRDIVLELGDDDTRRDGFTMFAVYPGDGFVDTEFTTRVLDDAEKYERDVRAWASLLDEGFESVRYNVHDGEGDGVLNLHQRDPSEPTPPMSDVFDAMVASLGADPGEYDELQTQAWIGSMLATNVSGSPELPAGWGAVLDRVQKLDWVESSTARFEIDSSTLSLRGDADITADQTAEILGILTDASVLLPNVSVVFARPGSDVPAVVLYGVTP